MWEQFFFVVVIFGSESENSSSRLRLIVEERHVAMIINTNVYVKVQTRGRSLIGSRLCALVPAVAAAYQCPSGTTVLIIVTDSQSNRSDGVSTAPTLSLQLNLQLRAVLGSARSIN